MVPAKRFGAKVPQYFIGFGPTVWSRQAGETEYGLKALPPRRLRQDRRHAPAGAGARPERRPRRRDRVAVRQSNTGMFTQLISDARAAEWEFVRPSRHRPVVLQHRLVEEGDRDGGRADGQRAIAFLLFAAIFATVGNHGDVASTRWSPGPRLRGALRAAGRGLQPGDPETPAKQAGLQVGDRFERSTAPGHQLGAAAAADPRQRRRRGTIAVDRDGEPVTLQTNTTVTARPTSADDETLTQVGFLGVVAGTYLGPTHGGPLYTLERMGAGHLDAVQALGTLPVKVWHVGLGVVGVEQRDPGARSASSAAAGSPARPRRSDQLRRQRQVVFLLTARRRLQPVHRAVQLHPAAAAGRRPHRRRPLRGRPSRDRAAAAPARPRLRRRGQAAAGGVRRGRRAAGDGAGADRGRHRRPGRRRPVTVVGAESRPHAEASTVGSVARRPE